jgi:hypothetical protein
MMHPEAIVSILAHDLPLQRPFLRLAVPRPLGPGGLSAQERSDLVAFLQTL